MNKKIMPYIAAAIIVLSIASTKVQASTLTTSSDIQSIVENTGAVSNTYSSGFEFDYSTGTITRYSGSEQEITIPLTINGVEITKIGSQAFYGCTSLKQITIPEGIKSIGDSAFKGCSIKEVIIPDSISTSVSKSFDTNVKIKRNIKITKFITDKQNPYIIGDSINLTANSTGGNTEKSYKFTEEINGVSYELKQDDSESTSTSATASWMPLNKGTYKLYVEVSDCVGTGEKKEISVDVLSNLVVTDFKASYTSPQAPGKSIYLSASAVGTENLEYRFTAVKSGVEQEIRGYSTSSGVTWMPTSTGIYSIFVYVKDSNQRVIKKELNYKYEIKNDVVSDKIKENENTKKRILNAIQSRLSYLAVIPSKTETEDYYLELFALFDEVIAEHKELEPIVDCQISHLTDTSNGYTFMIKFKYRTAEDVERKKIEAVNSKVDEIINTIIKSDYNDFQKVYAVTRYVVASCEYDDDTASKLKANPDADLPDDPFNAYGALINGVAVCSGYSDAIQKLLTRCGVEATVINSDKMNHAWNVVKIEGNYYELDSTWMDGGTISDFFKYFVVSTSALSKDHTFDAKVPEVVNKCINNEYENLKDEFFSYKFDETTGEVLSYYQRYNNTTERLYYVATEGIYSNTVFGDLVELVVPGKIDTIVDQYYNYLYYLQQVTNKDGTTNSILKRINLKTKFIADALTLNIGDTIDEIASNDSDTKATVEIKTSAGQLKTSTIDLVALKAKEPVVQTGESDVLLQSLFIMMIAGFGSIIFGIKKAI